MTVLSIVQATMGRLSLTRPTVVVTSTDQQVIQMFELLKEEAKALTGRAVWQSMTKQETFVTTATEVQTNMPIPADLDRFIPDTFFNRTQQRYMIGPVTPQEWQALQAQPSLGFVYLAFREREGQFIVNPVPPAGDTIAYEYVSSYYAKSSADVAKEEFTSDDDTSYLDEELLKLGLRWRWKQAKGLEYGQDYDTYEREVEMRAGNDGGTRALDISGLDRYRFPGRPNIPQGNWGL